MTGYPMRNAAIELRTEREVRLKVVITRSFNEMTRDKREVTL